MYLQACQFLRPGILERCAINYQLLTFYSFLSSCRHIRREYYLARISRILDRLNIWRA